MKYKNLPLALILGTLSIFTLAACDRNSEQSNHQSTPSQADHQTSSASTSNTNGTNNKVEDKSATANSSDQANPTKSNNAQTVSLEPQQADPIPDFTEAVAGLHTATDAQKAQIYAKYFNATLGYLTLYATKSPKVFNNSLPLARRYSFNTILNAISTQTTNIINIVNDNNEDEINILLPYIYEGLNQNFQALVAQIKANPEKALVNKYDDFDLEQAYFPVLLAQLDATCKNNNYFNVDLNIIKKETTVTNAQTGESLPFPESEEKSLIAWNQRFARTCYATNILTQLVKNKTFSDEAVKNIATVAAKEIAKAREAYQAEQAQGNNPDKASNPQKGKEDQFIQPTKTSPESKTTTDKVDNKASAASSTTVDNAKAESTTPEAKANATEVPQVKSQYIKTPEPKAEPVSTENLSTIPSQGLYVKANEKGDSWIGIYSNGKLLTSRIVKQGTDYLTKIDATTYTIKVGAPYAVDVYIDGVKQKLRPQANPMRILVDPQGTTVR